MMDPTEPEYLPVPEGYAERVAKLEAAGHPAVEAHWMAACEAMGAVTRTNGSSGALFWYGEASRDDKKLWDKVAKSEGKRYFDRIRKDTLVGYLANQRNTAAGVSEFVLEEERALADFVKEKNLWDEWETRKCKRHAENIS